MSTSAQRIRLLFADDHPLIIDGMVALARTVSRFEVIATARGGKEAVERCLQHRPDVTVMDLGMGDLDGVAALEEIRAGFPAAKVLILTVRSGDEDVRRALKAGARGYLLKNAPWPKVVEAIDAVARGLRYIAPEAAAALADAAGQAALTAREREVLETLARGASNQEIADTLEISEPTVKAHVTSILAKLGVEDRTKAMAVALKRGLVHLG
ncbi:MAG TPA: response regulator transcription factor [Myxococcaceae bacterium]|nr:response regulator transcription factor [Myxococcaceae bacterium]